MDRGFAFLSSEGLAPKKGEIIETVDAGKIIKAKIDACREEQSTGSRTPLFQSHGARNIE
jgi:hypothetical protein